MFFAEVGPRTADILKKKKLNASSCTLRLEKRFRKQRSEQDFLDMLEVKSNGATKKD